MLSAHQPIFSPVLLDVSNSLALIVSA